MTMQKVAEALEPFALRAERYDDIPGVYRCHDNVELWQNGERIDISVGQLRAAREALAFVRALLRSDAQGERGGRKLVPVEPTKEMLEAGANNNPTCWNAETDVGFPSDVANDVYRAMLAAAPSTPSASDWEAGARAAREQDVAACKAAVPDDQPWPDRNARNRIMHFLAALQIPRRP